MAGMQRRHFLVTAPLALASGLAAAASNTVQSLDDALRWLDALEKGPALKTTGAWPIGTVLNHLAQSIEMSMDGYPEPKSAFFQNTAGSAAFAFFKWKGRMSHGLAEPIPGAPALALSGDAAPGAARLRAAIARFQRHDGVLRPHFAYGALSKSDYTAAHTLHIANHQDEIPALTKA
jgi:hypothetical protein